MTGETNFKYLVLGPDTNLLSFLLINVIGSFRTFPSFNDLITVLCFNKRAYTKDFLVISGNLLGQKIIPCYSLNGSRPVPVPLPIPADDFMRLKCQIVHDHARYMILNSKSCYKNCWPP